MGSDFCGDASAPTSALQISLIREISAGAKRVIASCRDAGEGEKEDEGFHHLTRRR
jgi:hypothetical protein